VLKWVTGHCNRAAVSRNRYGVEKTVDTHKILINEIKFYVIEYGGLINIYKTRDKYFRSGIIYVQN
jgi:hypothetical protein